MRIPFSSLTFPTDSAARLATLLPALSADQARDWTAQVYGYRNWSQLASEVGSTSTPVVAGLSDESKHALDAHALGWPTADSLAQATFQLEKLSALMGWPRHAVEHLYRVWEPRGTGSIKEVVLGDLGAGTPVWRLLGRSVFSQDEEWGSYAEYVGGSVYLGVPGTPAQRDAAVGIFLAKLPADASSHLRSSLSAELTKQPADHPDLRPVGGMETFAQVREMTFVACSREFEDEILGVVSATFKMTASSNGTHSASVIVARVVVPGESPDLLLTLCEAVAVATWEAVSRYLWCTLGNVDALAQVHVEYRADDALVAKCAEEILELIVTCCGWTDESNRPEDCGIHFDLSPQP